jgi:hypothetical protein
MNRRAQQNFLWTIARIVRWGPPHKKCRAIIMLFGKKKKCFAINLIGEFHALFAEWL